MMSVGGGYRRESARLVDWDYASAGWYFVTICTKKRQCLLGDIVDGEMRLSALGEIVAEEWQKTPMIRPNVMLDEWVIMPNHLHGIVVIRTPQRGVPTTALRAENGGQTPEQGVPTTDRPGECTMPRLKAGSLGAIIGQFKSACTKRIRAAGYADFAWQARFYDHVIRSEKSLQRIREYIVNNPERWAEDEDNPANLSSRAKGGERREV